MKLYSAGGALSIMLLTSGSKGGGGLGSASGHDAVGPIMVVVLGIVFLGIMIHVCRKP